MSTSKHIDKICCAALAFVLLLTFLFINADKLGVQAVSASPGYESRLFDTSAVHTIDIIMDDWDSFIENCRNEEYEVCTVLIDGEAYKNVGIRAKGNTSLTTVESYGNDRYSFKIEFDHYDNANTYYGLDKLCLNNIVQDNTYMKDYLTYRMMYSFGVDAPLCSYSYITVNGEDWGLYLAVESVEESFLQRNYGNDYGKLYKPDSMTMGGGRGNGADFDMDKFNEETRNSEDFRTEDFNTDNFDTAPPDIGTLPDMPENPPENFDFQMPDESMPHMRGNSEGRPSDMGGHSPASDDVSLIYTDDEYDSYSNIFENAKTTVSDSDKTRLIASLKQLNEGNDIEDIVEIDEVIRYFVVHNFVLNFDSYTGSMIHNYYLYEKDGQLSMIPWDYNLAFGGFLSNTDATDLINYPIDTPVSGGTLDSRPMLAWIFDNDTYTELYHQYFAEFISEYYDAPSLCDLIDSTRELIAPYIEKDPTKFCTYDEFETGVSALKEFCTLRIQSINGQLEGTIPSTADEQAADASGLIDGSSVSISAMGAMDNRMSPGNFGSGDFNSGNFSPDDFSPDDFGPHD
ncbi:MAG: CotH kinase family protein [Ruminococcus sp.]|nr:CotH kinase family protein [Ruminococcus sp.]